MKISDLLIEGEFKGQQIDPRATKQKKDLFKTKNPKVIAFRDSVLAKYPDAEFYDPRLAVPKDGSWHIAAVVNGEIVDELTGNAFKDLKRTPVVTGEVAEAGFDPNTGKPLKPDNAAFARAFKKIDAGAEPTSDIEWAVKLKMDGVKAESGNYGSHLTKYGVDLKNAKNVNALLSSVPEISELEKEIRDREVTATQNQQSDQMGALQHDLNIQQLIRQNSLDKADAQAMLEMDVEARQAIRERKQAMELEAKERLAKVEIEIRQSQENDKQREFELEKAKADHAHDVQVIQITAEGEYKKAKLEADYQIQLKQLENIDNAGERQNRLDVINTEKQKEIETINAATNARIRELQAGADANRAESDTRIREAFMGEFQPIWGSMIQRASQIGKTLGQSISAVTGALGKLGKVVMPKAESVDPLARIKELSGM